MAASVELKNSDKWENSCRGTLNAQSNKEDSKQTTKATKWLLKHQLKTQEGISAQESLIVSTAT